MTKEVDAKNQIWFEKEGKVVRLGLTRNFLDTLTECWHILPSNMKQIKQRAPLLTIESNDGLISLLSPVTGNLQNWDNKAANFPEKLTEDDVIVTLTSDVVEKAMSPTLEERQAAVRRLAEAGIAPPQPPRARPTTQVRNWGTQAVAGGGGAVTARTNAEWVQQVFQNAHAQPQRVEVRAPQAPINWEDFRLNTAAANPNPFGQLPPVAPPEELF